jgi:hypothetical protein
MVLRKKKININGKEIEVDVFDTSLIPGSSNEEAVMDNLLKEEEEEKEIKSALVKIKHIASKYTHRYKNVNYYFDIGQVLQFVVQKNFSSDRGKIWQRLAYDLEPDLFGGKKKNANEAKRHPEFMYLLAKINKKHLSKANWDQWYEILKFKGITNDEKVLNQILDLCINNKLSGIPLRKEINRLRNKS